MEEIKLNISSQNKNGSGISNKAIIFIVLGSVFFCIMLAVIIVFSAEGGSSSGGVAKVEVVSSEMSYEYSEYLGYDVEVNGTIKNNTSRDYSYVSVTFSIYDAQGNNLGTVIDNMNNLGAGETWRFSASLLYTDTKPVSYKLKEITKW